MTIEYFDTIYFTNAAPKVIRCFKHEELSDWCWHGASWSKPFADAPKSAQKWKVSHVGTLYALHQAIPRYLTYGEASEIARRMDEGTRDFGMSQVHLGVKRGDTRPSLTGWTPEFAAEIKAVISAILSEMKIDA